MIADSRKFSILKEHFRILKTAKKVLSDPGKLICLSLFMNLSINTFAIFLAFLSKKRNIQQNRKWFQLSNILVQINTWKCMLIIFIIINGRNEKFLIKPKLIDWIEKTPVYNLHLYKSVVITLETFLWSRFQAVYWLLNHIFLTQRSIN